MGDPENVASAEVVDGDKLRENKKQVLVAFVFWALLVGIMIQATPLEGGESSKSLPEFLLGLAASILVFLWCSFDAREREYPLSKSMKVVIILLSVFSLLIYLPRTWGRAALASIGWALLFALLLAFIGGVFSILLELIFGSS